MFEMTQIFKSGNINERVFPVVDMGEFERNDDSLKKIKFFWNNERNKKINDITQGISEPVTNGIKKIDGILNTIDDLWNFLCRYNSGNYEKLIENNAKLLMEEIKKYLYPELEPDTENFTPTTATMPTGTRVITQNSEKSLYIEKNSGNIIIN